MAAASPALAQQPVLFKPLGQHPASAAITRFLNFSGSAPVAGDIQIADADLNGDGLSEALLKYPDGTIHILALPPRKALVTLGKLPASTGMQITDVQDFGVRQIVTTGSAFSDYARTRYRWNPYAQRYEAAP